LGGVLDTTLSDKSFVSDFRQVGRFLLVLWLSPTNKTDCHNIAEILLKVALNTIKPNQANLSDTIAPPPLI
jgi:hypothetical protein